MKANFKKFDESLLALAKSKRMASVENTEKRSRAMLPMDDLNELCDNSYDNNQKLRIFEQLLYFDNWPLIETFIHHIEPIRVASYRPIAEALCNRVGAIIYSFYKSTFNIEIALKSKSDFKVTEIQSFDDITEILFPVLYVLGPYIYINIDIYKAVVVLLSESVKKVCN